MRQKDVARSMQAVKRIIEMQKRVTYIKRNGGIKNEKIDIRLCENVQT